MVEKTKLFMQPDTAQIHTDKELDLLALKKQGIEFITSVGHYKTESGECHYRYNPDKTYMDVSTAAGYNVALHNSAEKIGVEVLQGRIDYRFDSFDCYLYAPYCLSSWRTRSDVGGQYYLWTIGCIGNSCFCSSI